MTKAENTTPKTSESVHVIGIGRTGAVYVEALLRTGEVEDNLANDGATFASLLVDIGEDDLNIANDYARSFKSRLNQRKIAADKYHHESLVLEVDPKDFAKQLEQARPLHSAAIGEEIVSQLPKSFHLPKTGEHTPRAIARAVAAFGSHLGEKPLASALQRFVDQVKRARQKSTIMVAFGLAGGTGSGMALDLARQIRRLGLGDSVKVVGIGQLSHSGDGDYQNSLAQTMAIDEIDRTLRDASKNPFTGGFFIVSTEHSWQRLTAYTKTGLKEVRQNFKQLVTNRFVADSFMRWAVSDGSEHLRRVLARAAGKCIMFNVTKFSHPGVQVLPGQPRSTWDAVLQQWISFVPQYSGLNDSFKTDYIEAHLFGARYMSGDTMANDLKSLLVSKYMKKGSGDYVAYNGEFFDELTAYANVILPGIAKDDLAAYKSAQTKDGKLDAGVKALEGA